MWIKISEENPIVITDIQSKVLAEVLAINTTTGKAIWVKEQDGKFILQLETPHPTNDVERHLAWLGIFDSEDEAKKKCDEFLAKAEEKEGLFLM